MNSHLIITIGRQYGAGGVEVGRRLSRKLSIPFYDKDLLTQAAKESGIAEEFFHIYDEKLIGAMHYFGNTEHDAVTLPKSKQLFAAQTKTIRELATRGSCIFIGRCADFVLQDFANCVNVFLMGDIEAREKRMIDVYGIDPADVHHLIENTDKQRSRYYESITDREWNNVQNYDLAINTGRIGMPKAVDLILDYVRP